MSAITDLPSAADLDPIGNARRPAGPRRPRYGTHLFLLVMAVLWLIPLLWTLYTSLRPKAETDKYGYWSLPRSFTLHNFSQAWSQGGMQQSFLNSVYITVPTVLLTLLLASLMAFAVSRFTWKFNVSLLIVFTAGNMLPPQVLAAPLFSMFKHTPLPLSRSATRAACSTPTTA